MGLTERYVYAVTKHLPQSQREDVAKELRGTIEDMASDHAKKDKPSEADVKAVLKKLGDPTVFARKYSTAKNYLIGPQWYDTYFALLKQLLYIVPGIVTVVMLVVNYMNLELTNGNLITMIIGALGAGITTAVHIAFWVTVVFACLERFAVDMPELKELKEIGEITGHKKAWSPDELPSPPKKRQIGLIESATSAGLIALGIGWVAFSPIISSNNGQPLFNPELWNLWIPVFFVLAGLALIHKLFQVKIGNWTTPLMVTNVLLGLAGIAYVLALITNAQVFNVEFLHSLPTTEDVSFEKITQWARWTVAISAAAFIGTYVWDMVSSIRLNRQLKVN